MISSPVIASDTVYIGSTDTFLYALAADTGTLNWKYRTENKIYSAPDVQGDQVYFSSVDGALFAVK